MQGVVVRLYNFDWIQQLYYEEYTMNKKYRGPYYVIDKNKQEVFTYKKDVGKRYKVYGTFSEMQVSLSKKGLILTRGE